MIYSVLEKKKKEITYSFRSIVIVFTSVIRIC